MNKTTKAYIVKKILQANRLQKQPLEGEELQTWVRAQILKQTELFKNIIRESIAVAN